MSKNDEYVLHMRKLFFFSADPTTNSGALWQGSSTENEQNL